MPLKRCTKPPSAAPEATGFRDIVKFTYSNLSDRSLDGRAQEWTLTRWAQGAAAVGTSEVEGDGRGIGREGGGASGGGLFGRGGRGGRGGVFWEEGLVPGPRWGDCGGKEKAGSHDLNKLERRARVCP